MIQSRSKTRRIRDPSNIEAGLLEITKAISSAKETVESITSKDFMENHKKIREASLRKYSAADHGSIEVVKSRNSYTTTMTDNTTNFANPFAPR